MNTGSHTNDYVEKHHPKAVFKTVSEYWVTHEWLCGKALPERLFLRQTANEYQLTHEYLCGKGMSIRLSAIQTAQFISYLVNVGILGQFTYTVFSVSSLLGMF